MSLADPSNFFVNPKSIRIKYTSQNSESRSHNIVRRADQVNDDQTPDNVKPALKDWNDFPKSLSPKGSTLKHNRALQLNSEAEPSSESSDTTITDGKLHVTKGIQTMADFTRLSQMEETLSAVLHKLNAIKGDISMLFDRKSAITEGPKQCDVKAEQGVELPLGKSVLDKHVSHGGH